MSDWNPELYNRFHIYRREPVEIIFTRLPLAGDDEIADFGCGTGEHTVELVRRAAPSGRAVGVDSSPAMIQQAHDLRRRLESQLAGRISFVKGDFRVVSDECRYSVIFSNAALQWARDHREVLSRWFRALKPGGRMVIQMPSNHHETTQTTLGEVAGEPAWKDLIGDLQTPSRGVEEPEQYRAMLGSIGFAEIDCYYHTFRHPMDNPGAIVEFSRATALRDYVHRIPMERQGEFIEYFTRRLEQAYGTRGPLTFSFRRLFLWGRRPHA